MNWLAHIFLSPNNVEYQLGNLLADKLRGKYWDGANNNVIQGFEMHKIIDTYTDSHKKVLLSKSRLGENGYLKGVVVDVVYDHLLLNNWNEFSKISLEMFIHNFNVAAITKLKDCPKHVSDFVSSIIKIELFTSYKSMEGVLKAFNRIDKRLSAKLLKRETTSQYINKVVEEIDEINNDFIHFFPDLIDHVKTNCKLPINHLV